MPAIEEMSLAEERELRDQCTVFLPGQVRDIITLCSGGRFTPADLNWADSLSENGR